MLEMCGIVVGRTNLADSCCDVANNLLVFASLGLIWRATNSRYCFIVACTAMPSRWIEVHMAKTLVLLQTSSELPWRSAGQRRWFALPACIIYNQT